MCYYYCGDRNRLHDPPDGRSLWCRDCADRVSDDFEPYRSDEWDLHVEDRPGVEHHRWLAEDGEELYTTKPVGGFSVGQLVEGHDIAGNHAVGHIVKFASLGDQGFIAILDVPDTSFYIEDMDMVEVIS